MERGRVAPRCACCHSTIPSLAGKTVGDVLADPGALRGRDPRRSARGRRVRPLQRQDYAPRPTARRGSHSFAHGRTIYELKRDAAAVRKAMEAAAKDDVVATFVRLAVAADLDAIELEDLRQLAKKLSGTGLRVIDAALKAAQQKQAAQDAKAARRPSGRRTARPTAAHPGAVPGRAVAAGRWRCSTRSSAR